MVERDWKAEVVKQWNADPCGADRTNPFGSREFFERVERERYREYAPWLPGVVGFDRYAGQRVLEVGFGLGTDLISFARGGAQCFGIDLTPAHIEAATRRFVLEGFPVRIVRGDAEFLPFEDESMDAVYSFGVLHHTPQTRKAVMEIHRVLRVGGHAVVALYHRDSAFWIYTLLVRGILRGAFFRMGYRRTVSQIERREHSDAVPLVKVYSRRGVRSLFSVFDDVGVQAKHFGHGNFGSSSMKRILDRYENVLGNLFGWYLIVRARKLRTEPRR
jgi:SAM-dependent methyltransferase